MVGRPAGWKKRSYGLVPFYCSRPSRFFFRKARGRLGRLISALPEFILEAPIFSHCFSMPNYAFYLINVYLTIYLFQRQHVCPFQLPISSHCNPALYLHLRLHSLFLAWNSRQVPSLLNICFSNFLYLCVKEQDRPSGKLLEAGSHWRKTESLGGWLLCCYGRTLSLHCRLIT